MVDFLGIGVQKGGTSWFYQNIVRHPDVWLPFIKEVHFFDRRLLGREALERVRHTGDFEDLHIVRLIRLRIRKLREGKIYSDFGRQAEIAYLKRLVDRDFYMTDDWYDFLFSAAPATQKTGEITPFYCAIGEAGIAGLNRRYPAARMIYLIRDPVDRALSCLRMVGKRSGVAMTEPQAVAKLAEECIGSAGFYSRGDFRSHIPLWDRYFGDRMLYLPFGRISADPAGIFRQVEGFLEINRFDGYPSLHERIHPTMKATPEMDEVRRRFAAANAEQYAFLKDRFDAAFNEQLR